jgi:hypothetical protein
LRQELVLTGTPSQIELGTQLRARVMADFDRLAQALLTVARQQPDADRAATEAIVALLEEKRDEVLSHTHAGYFIHKWPEPGDRVREMLLRDPRFQGMKAK